MSWRETGRRSRKRRGRGTPRRGATPPLRIGFIVGDDVTAQDETMVAMTAELCEAPACSCAAGGGMSDGEWNELKSSWPRLVRPQVCKMGPQTRLPERTGSSNSTAGTLGQAA